jgi:hypothetical protein
VSGWDPFCKESRALSRQPGEPQISPLRSPGFPVETRDFDDLHAALSTESRTRERRKTARSRKSGYAPVEMTKGRVFMTRSSDLGNRNRRSVHALRSVEKHFHERTAAPQISPLRFAPVEMTKGRAVLPGTVVAESWACDPPKVMKNGSNHCGKPMRCLSSAKRGSAWRPFRRESVVR